MEDTQLLSTYQAKRFADPGYWALTILTVSGSIRLAEALKHRWHSWLFQSTYF